MRKNLPIHFIMSLFLFLGISLSSQGQVIVTLGVNQAAQLNADAGADVIICLGDTGLLGGTPSGNGGTGAYTYSWSPSTNLSSATAANPMAWPSVPTSYVLTLMDDAGCTSLDTVTLTPDTCLGFQDFSWVSSLDLFPNPTQGGFTIRLTTSKEVKNISIQVLSLLGQEISRVHSESVNGTFETKFDLSGQSSGVYLVRLDGNGQTMVRKVMLK
ncbi:MAG: T9SS type A sorting domain-containing protein [Bacteroidia bacterium]|nr:T9SS type A sorting domain-containing protein [Bacteroidia bacterium]